MRSFTKTAVGGRQFRPAQVKARSNSWTSDVVSTDLKGWQSPRKQYERYMALALSQAQSEDMVGAENYYQHAEHYFRSISATPAQ
jgi:Domain of unknown function (DUF4167)